MDEKRRSKRKSMEDGFWDCSVCTYRNTPEAFKCDICDVRKGTSTRKPRFNPQLAAQQVVQQFVPLPKKEKPQRRDRESRDRDLDLDRYNDDSNFAYENLDTDQTNVHSHEIEMDMANVLDEGQHSAEKPKSEKVESRMPTPPKKEKKTPSDSQPRKPRTPRLKNIDRSSGTSMEVTVGGVTVLITDYKPKKTASCMPGTSLETSAQKQLNQSSLSAQSVSDSFSIHKAPDKSWSNTSGNQ